MKQPKQHHSKGYTLVELLLAVVIGSIIIAATYGTYALISRQYQLLSSFSEVQESGMPTLRLVERDLRQAGYVARDAALDPVFGVITQPVIVTDSGNACCDQLRLFYDKDATSRLQITYKVGQRLNPIRNALLMDISSFNGTTWTPTVTDALVADYVDNFQVRIAATSGGGAATQVDAALTLRSRLPLPEVRNFVQSNYDTGNFAFSASDNYFRDTISTTVHIRNVQ